MVTSTPLPFPPEPATWPAVQATRFALDRADHREGRRGAFLKTLDAVSDRVGAVATIAPSYDAFVASNIL